MPDYVKDVDWMEMMSWAEQQAIVGIIYMGIKKAENKLHFVLCFVHLIVSLQTMN